MLKTDRRKIVGGAVHTRALRELIVAARMEDAESRERAVADWWMRWTASCSAAAALPPVLDLPTRAAVEEAHEALARATVSNMIATAPGVIREADSTVAGFKGLTRVFTLSVLLEDPIEEVLT